MKGNKWVYLLIFCDRTGLWLSKGIPWSTLWALRVWQLLFPGELAICFYCVLGSSRPLLLILIQDDSLFFFSFLSFFWTLDIGIPFIRLRGCGTLGSLEGYWFLHAIPETNPPFETLKLFVACHRIDESVALQFAKCPAPPYCCCSQHL